MNNSFYPWTRTTRNFLLKHLCSHCLKERKEKKKKRFPIFTLFQFQARIFQARVWPIALITHHLTVLRLQSIIATKLVKYIKFSHTSWTRLNFTEKGDGALSNIACPHWHLFIIYYLPDRNRMEGTQVARQSTRFPALVRMVKHNYHQGKLMYCRF